MTLSSAKIQTLHASAYTSVASLIDLYDVWLVDLYGVIYDGGSVFDHAKETLRLLMNNGKTVLFLSNAPRRTYGEMNKLLSEGLDRSDFSEMLTSGEATYTYLMHEAMVPGIFPKGFAGHRYVFFGEDWNRHMLAELKPNYEEVSSLKDANFVFLVGPIKPGTRVEDYKDFIREAIDRDIPFVCANPDRRAIVKEHTIICSGAVADFVEECGGEVLWIGKPMPSFYEKAIHYLTQLGYKIPSKDKMVMVGDSLETDVPGANSFGIDSILIHKTGIHGNIPLDTLINSYPLKPTHIAHHFA